jgi:S1-C subfamily serine protease
MMVRLIFLMALGLLRSICGQAQLITPEENYARNAPGVVMVQTVFTATVYVNKVDINKARFERLVDSVKRLDPSGNILSAEAKLDILVRALSNSPNRYFTATPEYFSQNHRIIASGTGFFVTEDGYIVTNSHILDRDSAFIRSRFIQNTYQDVTNAHIRSLEESWEMMLTDEQRDLLNNAYGVIYSQVSSMVLFDLRKEIFVQFRLDRGSDRAYTRRLPANLVIKGAAMPGKDIAILKVENVRQMPTLALSQDSLVRIGEPVLVYGYPEPVTSNFYLARETSLEPSLTAGVVSAIKTSVSGWPVIQMDAVITHGSSGSPVCNNRGQVIGIATFGSIDRKASSLASGFNFSLPAYMIREFLDSAGIVTAMSDATRSFNRGLGYFYDGYYNKAVRRFEVVERLNPHYPELRYYLQSCHARIDAGKDREAISRQSMFRILALLLLGGGLFIFYRWKRGE